MSQEFNGREVSGRELSRRHVIKLGMGGLVGAGLGLSGVLGWPSVSQASGLVLPKAGRKRVARLVHMTDTHLQPEKAGYEGVQACLRHIAAASDKPDVIITGGDLIMDSYDQQTPRAEQLWDLWGKVFKDECAIRVEHCLGNHDIWGWNKKESGTTGEEARWGKKWAMEVLGLKAPYHAFDLGDANAGVSWRCIILDSVQPHPEDPSGYIGQLDPAQWAWLEGELKAAGNRPVLLVSHIPILSASALAYDSSVKGNAWVLSGSNQMIDGKKLIKLFSQHPNVKLSLSGHIHKLDRTEYEGVTYICDGAVCGAWWAGPKDRVAEGYGVVDLYDDGTIGHEYVTYGWQAQPNG